MQAQLRSVLGVGVAHLAEQQPLPEQPPQALTGELVCGQLAGTGGGRCEVLTTVNIVLVVSWRGLRGL